MEDLLIQKSATIVELLNSHNKLETENASLKKQLKKVKALIVTMQAKGNYMFFYKHNKFQK